MQGFNRNVDVLIPVVNPVAATGVLTSDNSANVAGETVTIRSTTYTFNTGVTGTAATGVLTSSNVQVSDNDTVTIGTVVYRFKTTIAQIGDIHIVTNADTSLTNLANAINGAGVAGTDYFTGTPANLNVSASAVSSHAITLTDLAVGTAGNAVATTKVAVTLSFGATTLTGGIDIINSILIGANADASLTNLAAAINGAAGSGTTYGTGTVANPDVSSGAVSSHTITLTAKTLGNAANSYATTETGAHLSFGDTTLNGGEGGQMTAYLFDTTTITTLAMDVGPYYEATLFLNTTAHAGTNPTMDAVIQYSPDNVNWVNSGDAITQITTSNALTFKKLTLNFGRFVRLIFTLGGTTPSYTADIKLLGKL